MQGERLCHIVSASVEEENGAGDGAYDLFDTVGTPDEIGKAIQAGLQSDLIHAYANESHLLYNANMAVADP